jgi:hypothetical protein
VESATPSSESALQQQDKTNLFLVYPNPARDILHVQTNGNASFSLVNQSGQTLLTTISPEMAALIFPAWQRVYTI